MRKIYIILVLLIIGMMGMTYLYFSNLNTETTANNLSLKVVASKSAMIFSFDNDKGFYDILDGQNLIQKVIGDSNARLFKALKQNFIDDKLINNLIDGQKIYIGISSAIDQKIDFLITTQSQNIANNSLNNAKIIKSKVDRLENVYLLTFSDRTSFYLAIKNHMILISNSLDLIESSIKINSDEDNFNNFIKSNSRFNKNTLANLYIDFNKMPAVLKGILNSNLTGRLSVLDNQNSYAALSYNFSSERLLFNGITALNDKNSYYQLFANIEEQKITINSILPEKTANYTAFAISSYSNWSKSLAKLMEVRKEDQVIKNSLQRINETYRIDLLNQFPLYLNNQFITFQLNTGEKLGAISLNNGDKVYQLLLDISTEYALNIRIFKEANIVYAFFGDPFKKFERPFYTIVNGYLVFANNASSVQSFLNSYNSNQLLINDNNYQKFNNQLSTSATITHYISNKNSVDIFRRNLKSTYYKKLISKNEMADFSDFSYQLTGDKGRFLSNILLYKIPEATIEIDSLIKIK